MLEALGERLVKELPWEILISLLMGVALAAVGVFLFRELVLPYIKTWFNTDVERKRCSDKYIKAIVVGIVLIISVCFFGVGLRSTLTSLSSLFPTKLNILTSLASEELAVFNNIIAKFEKKHKYAVKVEVQSKKWDEILNDLKEDKNNIDLITVEINRRWELLEEKDKLMELSDKDYKGLPPSSVNPILIDILECDNKKYFMPFRINVKVAFINKEKLTDFIVPKKRDEIIKKIKGKILTVEKCKNQEPQEKKVLQTLKDLKKFKEIESWEQISAIAKALYYLEDEEAKVAIQLHEKEIHITLFELIRSFGGNPYNLCKDNNTQNALCFLKYFYQNIHPDSHKVNWQTATGFILNDDIYLLRNWPFSIGLLHEAGRIGPILYKPVKKEDFKFFENDTKNKQVLLELLENKIIINYEFDSDSVVFDKKIYSKTQIKEWLRQIKILDSRDVELILDLWEKSQLTKDDFVILPGFRGNGKKPVNYLGGELFAVPNENDEEKEKLIIELLKFIMSRDVQLNLAEKLRWPAMRLDIMGGIPVWQKSYHETINKALRYAEPLPRYWYTNLKKTDMQSIYEDLFKEIIKNGKVINDCTLRSFQDRIDAVPERNGLHDVDCFVINAT